MTISKNRLCTNNCFQHHLLNRFLEQRQEALNEQVFASQLRFFAPRSALRGFACTKPHNSNCLAVRMMLRICEGGGSWWRLMQQRWSSIWRTEGGEGGRQEWLQVDWLRPTRCGASVDVLNLLSTLVLRPRQGGWK